MAATLFQKNKRSYLDEEGKLHATLCDKSFQSSFQTWLDATLAELDRLYEGCEQQLGELQQSVTVEEGDYWNSRTLMQHCNLHIGEKRLIHKGMDLQTHPSWPDMVRLVSVLSNLKSKGFISPQQAKFIGQVEQELRNVVFEPRDLNYITSALETKLRDDTTTRNVFNELTKYQNSIDELSPALDSCEQRLESAISEGEMLIAEETAMEQLDKHEHMLKLITDQYPIIHEYYTETEDRKRTRRWAIFRMANKDITTVVEGKHRQIEACKEDLMRIKEQVENYSGDDGFQRKRYVTDCQESDSFLAQNKEKQQAVWNRIFDIFQELQSCQDELVDLANNRKTEIDRRLKLEEREAGRRSGHEAFIRVASAHTQLLEDTIDNATAARDLASALNDFVLDGCENVTSKFDRQQSALGEMLRLVQNHHFRRFTDFYLSAGRMLYRKEQKMKRINDSIVTAEANLLVASESLDPIAKKYFDEKREWEQHKSEVAGEIVKLHRRITEANNAIAPTLRSFDFHGINYMHPEDILDKVVTDRMERILDYREIANPDVMKNDIIMKEELEALKERSAETRTIQESRRSQKLLMASAGADSVAALNPKPPSQADGSTAQNYSRFKSLIGPKTSTSQNAPPLAIVTSETKPDVPDGQPLQSGSRLEGTSLRALFKYKARQPDELSFEKGDIIICVSDAAEAGWYKGMCNQRSGLFPVNYVTKAD